MDKKPNNLPIGGILLLVGVAGFFFVMLATDNAPKEQPAIIEEKSDVNTVRTTSECGKYEIRMAGVPSTLKATELDFTHTPPYLTVKTCDGSYDHLLISWYNIIWVKYKQSEG